MKRVTGCIIRVKHNDKAVCDALAKEFNDYYEVQVIEITHTRSPIVGYMFWMEQRGNLDLEGWLHNFAGDLEDMRTYGVLPNFGNSLDIHIELVY
jgi:hypothetical protein